jgi:predicted glycosyltransferase
MSLVQPTINRIIKLSEEILQRWNYNFINRFDECWVPDNKDENNLAGELSHPKKLPGIPVKYIGHLSRLEKRNTSEIKNHLLIIVSGPEPQRNLFENKIIDEIIYYPGTVTVVRGLPSGDTILPSTNSIQFYNHMTGEELSNEAAKAEYIISRSGYSTVMDIAALQKKSILVPTPGQTEQEYLAGFLLKKQFAYSINQKEFSLQRSLENARRFAYRLDQF